MGCASSVGSSNSPKKVLPERLSTEIITSTPDSSNIEKEPETPSTPSTPANKRKSLDRSDSFGSNAESMDYLTMANIADFNKEMMGDSESDVRSVKSGGNSNNSSRNGSRVYGAPSGGKPGLSPKATSRQQAKV